MFNTILGEAGLSSTATCTVRCPPRSGGHQAVALTSAECHERTLARPATLRQIQSQIQTSRVGPPKHRSEKASSGKEALNALKLVGNDFADMIEMSSERLVLF